MQPTVYEGICVMICTSNTVKQMYKQHKEAFTLSNNYCCECKEGSPIGGKVYCNVDLRQHPMHDNRDCDWFILKKNIDDLDTTDKKGQKTS